MDDDADSQPTLRAPAIRDRCFEYALRAISLYRYLSQRKDSAGMIIGRQFLRAATSVGANVEESQAGESRADFIHKLSIAQKEARESVYWLKLLKASSILPADRISSLLQESEEILSVLSKIIVSTKRKQSR